MRYDADTPLGDFGPEEIVMNDWLEESGPYITLPADTDAGGDDEDE